MDFWPPVWGSKPNNFTLEIDMETLQDKELEKCIMDVINKADRIDSRLKEDKDTGMMRLWDDLRNLYKIMREKYGVENDWDREVREFKEMGNILPEKIQHYIPSIILNVKRCYRRLEGDKSMKFVTQKVHTEFIEGAFGDEDPIVRLQRIFEDDKMIRFHRDGKGVCRLLCGENFPDWANE